METFAQRVEDAYVSVFVGHAAPVMTPFQDQTNNQAIRDESYEAVTEMIRRFIEGEDDEATLRNIGRMYGSSDPEIELDLGFVIGGEGNRFVGGPQGSHDPKGVPASVADLRASYAAQVLLVRVPGEGIEPHGQTEEPIRVRATCFVPVLAHELESFVEVASDEIPEVFRLGHVVLRDRLVMLLPELVQTLHLGRFRGRDGLRFFRPLLFGRCRCGDRSFVRRRQRRWLVAPDGTSPPCLQ